MYLIIKIFLFIKIFYIAVYFEFAYNYKNTLILFLQIISKILLKLRIIAFGI